MLSKTALFVLAAAAVLGCGATTVETAHDAGPKAGVFTKCGSLHLPDSRAACATCLDGSCCGEAAACGADAECAALFECVFACPTGDTACPTGCFSAHSRGIATFQAGNSCGVGSCGNPCNLVP